VASPAPKTILRRARYEFRRLWDSYRVRAFAGLLNLGAVATGLALSWDANELALQIGATVGAMVAGSTIAVVAVFLFSLAVAWRRITEERITALEKEQTGTAPPPVTAPVYIQIIGGDVRIGSVEAHSASETTNE